MCKEEMMDVLEQYYEAAGFADFYNKVLKNMSEEESEKLYNKTISEEDDD